MHRGIILIQTCLFLQRHQTNCIDVILTSSYYRHMILAVKTKLCLYKYQSLSIWSASKKGLMRIMSKHSTCCCIVILKKYVMSACHNRLSWLCWWAHALSWPARCASGRARRGLQSPDANSVTWLFKSSKTLCHQQRRHSHGMIKNVEIHQARSELLD
jgi:hypothetical protein